MIWMHGLGADATDFEPIVEMLDLNSQLRFVFPNAPVRPVTINGGMEMRAWYDIDPGNPLSGGDDIRTASEQIRQLIEREAERGIPAKRVTLAGFSQGGVIALHLGLRHTERLAGVMALSTYVHDHEHLTDEVSFDNIETPIFMAHGITDPMIPITRAITSREAPPSPQLPGHVARVRHGSPGLPRGDQRHHPMAEPNLLARLQPTDPRWVEAVLEDFDGFLKDHASCEKKASGMALNVASHYPDRPVLLAAMAELAAEELAHYREVIKLLIARSLAPSADRKDPYIHAMNQQIRTGSERFLLDRLLVGAVVEARGCERFGLVASRLAPGEPAPFTKPSAAAKIGTGSCSWAWPAVSVRTLPLTHAWQNSSTRRPRSSPRCRYAPRCTSPHATEHPLSIDAYLARHAWADSAGAVAAITGEYQQVIVVPAFDEPAGFPGRVLRNVREQVDVLMIAVLNAPDSAPAAAIARTRTLLEDLGGDGSARFSLAKAGRSVLLVDCVTASRRLPKRQGVGLARKIGNDIALTLMQSGQVHPGWLFNTDADTVLPADYFDQAPPERTDAALTFPFHHVASDPALARKAALYELHLSYYRNRLAFAGSPYAFFTLGSTIAINPLAYAKVRGFPRRNAAEDFYLLNKLAKVGSVRSLATPTLTIDARLSERVPFGTGPALRPHAERRRRLLELRAAHVRLAPPLSIRR